MPIPVTSISPEQIQREDTLLGCIRSSRPTPFKALALQEYCMLLQGAGACTKLVAEILSSKAQPLDFQAYTLMTYASHGKLARHSKELFTRLLEETPISPTNLKLLTDIARSCFGPKARAALSNIVLYEFTKTSDPQVAGLLLQIAAEHKKHHTLSGIALKHAQAKDNTPFINKLKTLAETPSPYQQFFRTVQGTLASSTTEVIPKDQLPTSIKTHASSDSLYAHVWLTENQLFSPAELISKGLKEANIVTVLIEGSALNHTHDIPATLVDEIDELLKRDNIVLAFGDDLSIDRKLPENIAELCTRATNLGKTPLNFEEARPSEFLTCEERYKIALQRIITASSSQKVLVLGSLNKWGGDSPIANYSHIVRDNSCKLFQIGICCINITDDHNNWLTRLGGKNPHLLCIPGQNIYATTTRDLTPFAIPGRADGLIVCTRSDGDSPDDALQTHSLPPAHRVELAFA